MDFGAESAVTLLSELPNLLVVMTYSKSRSLAGARLGFALGSSELIADLERLKYSTNPYNVNRLTQKLGIAALASDAYFKARCAEIAKTRETSIQRLADLGFDTLPSKANFVFTRHPNFAGEALYLGLKVRGVLVRHWKREPIADYLRITIGTPEEMETLFTALNELFEEAGKA